MRGEHDFSGYESQLDQGSSPHARGALAWGECRRIVGRIIPACAGSTPTASSPSTSKWDHPRMRGEHCVLAPFTLPVGDHPRMRGEHMISSYRCVPTPGSSPHARGARCINLVKAHKHGIIPACAGSIPTCRFSGRSLWDHPRMRGEHKWIQVRHLLLRGSSPHARGAPVGPQAHAVGIGIIPACAGSTTPSSRFNLVVKGSSPHARGALRLLHWDARQWRIIPACAGSTGRALSGKVNARDHPRMRGEHCLRVVALFRLEGSSPHARGAPASGASGMCWPGIIPACAGSTTKAETDGYRCGDHPRMRGEHSSFNLSSLFSGGSSPHARGARRGR